jgi:hypothetical protein
MIMARVRGRRGSIIEEIPRAPAGCERATSHEVHGSSAIERGLALILERAGAGYETHGRWETRVRAALSALLCLFDEQPDLARLCVVQSANSGPAALALREQVMTVLARRIDDGRRSAPLQPPPRAAETVLAGALGAIRGRLLQSEPTSVGDLLDPLMSFIVLPYRGAAAALRELHEPVAAETR